MTTQPSTTTPNGRVWLSKIYLPDVSESTLRNANIYSLFLLIIVTGASSGFGYEVTRYALSRRDKVVVTTRNPSSPLLVSLSQTYPSPQLTLLEKNITDVKDIQRAFSRIQEIHGKLDVVFSNAGYTLLAEVEGTPEEEARKLFEANFWASVRVMQEAVKFFREVNPKGVGGKIIQNSSASGMYCFPAQGIYSASKHGECELTCRTTG